MRWRRILRSLLLVVLSGCLLFLLAPEWPAFASQDYRLRQIVGQREFDFLGWELNAFRAKGDAGLAGGQRYLDTAVRKQIVLDYLALVAQARQLEAELNQIYSDPAVADPDQASRALQERLTAVRASIDAQQLLAESIVQEQVATVLVEEGFGLAGIAWPPVLMHMTPLPSVLVTSPRDRIEKEHQISLVHGLSTPQREAMEDAVLDDLNLSTLVVDIGGAGTYPSMITETSSINWLAEVVAHEWSHHWLTLRPLGVMYPFDPNMRIVNETVASIVDQEIGRRVIERYYPEFLPPEPDDAPPGDGTTAGADTPAVFDFRAEMAATRIRVDELLAAGKIDEAENYMEMQRRVFVSEGYNIRKLNQAYFAFHGAYAAEPGGAQGGNPIGPMLRGIRENTPTVKAFLNTVAPITTFAQLEKVYEDTVGSPYVAKNP